MQDNEKVEKGLQAAQTQAIEATLLVKEIVEVNTQTQKDLCICINQVYELRQLLNTLGTQPPPLSMFASIFVCCLLILSVLSRQETTFLFWWGMMLFDKLGSWL